MRSPNSLDEAIGTSRGGPTSKVIALTDRSGRFLRFSLRPGYAAESKELIPLLDRSSEQASWLLADRTYDSQAMQEDLERRATEAVIPSTRARKLPHPYDANAYRARRVVENAFADLKQFRGIATRYCKLASTFASLLSLGCWVLNTRATRRGASPYD
ncbi:IS5 family transposase [Candidatus Poriferisodalis sp.]|uniref:IS5 family transposase n=1 Tax=Candidatus Poriferisodalis sp. TaxID=3101277 RepID=UPI003B0166F6